MAGIHKKEDDWFEEFSEDLEDRLGMFWKFPTHAAKGHKIEADDDKTIILLAVVVLILLVVGIAFALGVL